jgi:hypothetical protein
MSFNFQNEEGDNVVAGTDMPEDPYARRNAQLAVAENLQQQLEPLASDTQKAWLKRAWDQLDAPDSDRVFALDGLLGEAPWEIATSTSWMLMRTWPNI